MGCIRNVSLPEIRNIRTPPDEGVDDGSEALVSQFTAVESVT